MKQQKKIKQLALFGLASGLLAAASTAQAAENASPNRPANGRAQSTQPIAGCGSGCSAVADNFAPNGSGCAGRPSGSGCAGKPSGSCGGKPASSYQDDGRSGEWQTVKSGCQGRSYQSGEILDGGTDPYPQQGQQARAGQPQSTFRYVGDNSMAPKVPSELSQPSARPLNVNVQRAPSATFTPQNEYPAGNPSAATQRPPYASRPVNAQQRFNQSRIADDFSGDRVNHGGVPAYGHEDTAPTSTPPKSDAPKKTFW